MAHELGRELITVAGHEDMTSADLVGRFLLKGGETVWVDGPLTRAVREGAICYLDEVVEARQDTTVVIHPLADHRRELPIDRLATTLPAAQGFQLVISYNPGYQSVLKNIKESTRQRFIAIELGFPPVEIETEVVAYEAGIDSETARTLVKLGNAIRNLDWFATARSVLNPDVDPRRRPCRRRAEPAQCRPVRHRAGPLRRSGCRPRPGRTRRCRPAPDVNALNPRTFRLLATFIAGRSVDIAEASPGEAGSHRRQGHIRLGGPSSRRAAPRDAAAERPARRGESGSTMGEGVAGTSLVGAPLPGARRSPSAYRARQAAAACRRAVSRRRTAHRDHRRVTRDGQEPS